MKRFFIFPATLGFVSAFLPVVCFIVWILSLYPLETQMSLNTSRAFHEEMPEIWEATWPYGLAAGFIVGIGLALWDLIRNSRNHNSIARLGANIFWCACYALLLHTVNVGLVALVSTQIQIPATPSFGVGRLLLGLVLASALIINLTAILWAAIRSITTTDILTPRILRGKLRERMRLQ